MILGGIIGYLGGKIYKILTVKMLTLKIIIIYKTIGFILVLSGILILINVK
jgi:hypothetical protein